MIRVVVIEDDETTRSSLCAKVRNADGLLLVGEAGDVRQARVLISGGKIDVVLLDLNLDGLDATGLILLAKQDPEIKVLVISVLAGEQDVLRAIRAGADGYLIKNTSIADIERCVTDVHAGIPPLSPAVARFLLRSQRPAAVAKESPASKLAPRELQMLKSMASGFTYREIAERHGISYHTVVDYVRSTYRKLDVSSRSEALMFAVREGLISPKDDGV